MDPKTSGAVEPNTPGVASTVPVSALTFALARGVSVTDLEEVAGVPVAELLAADGHVADDLPVRIMKSLERSGICEAPALEVASMTPYALLGGLERAAAYAPNGLRALEIFHEFASTRADRTVTWVEESDRYYSFHFTHPLDAFDDGLTHEMQLSLVWRFLREVLGRRFAMEEAHFGFSAHGPQARYNETFDAPVRFGRSSGEHVLVFRKDVLLAENPSLNPLLYEAGRVYLRELASQRTSVSVGGPYKRLVRAVNACVEAGEWRSEAIAQAAAMTVRTAQRVAAARQTSLRGLIDAARLNTAKTMILADPRIRLENVAQQIGFSDERAFRRFFKRLAGVSPSEYRTGVHMR